MPWTVGIPSLALAGGLALGVSHGCSLLLPLIFPPRSGSGLLRSIFTTDVYFPVFSATYCAHSGPFHVRRRVQVADIFCLMLCREVSKLSISVGDMSFVCSIFICCRSVCAWIVSSWSLSIYLLYIFRWAGFWIGSNIRCRWCSNGLDPVEDSSC